MSGFTYSGDPSTSDLDAVRFYTGDTDPEEPLLGDSEIAFLLAEHGERQSNVYVASKAASRIAARFAREVSVSADGENVDLASLATRFTDLAADLMAEFRSKAGETAAPVSGGVYYGDQPRGVVPFEFGVGLHDNDRAGSQSYGGEVPAPSYDPTREQGQW